MIITVCVIISTGKIQQRYLSLYLWFIKLDCPYIAANPWLDPWFTQPTPKLPGGKLAFDVAFVDKIVPQCYMNLTSCGSSAGDYCLYFYVVDLGELV